MIERVEVSGSPSDEEVAAVLVAVEVLWPKPVAATRQRLDPPPTWRFSGRWWADPLVRRRRRP